MILKDKCKGFILNKSNKEKILIPKAFYVKSKHGSKRVNAQDWGRVVCGHVGEQALYVTALWTLHFPAVTFQIPFILL